MTVEVVAGCSLRVDDEAYAEVRAFLDELSRTRARLGFSPTETLARLATARGITELRDRDDEDGDEVPGDEPVRASS